MSGNTNASQHDNSVLHGNTSRSDVSLHTNREICSYLLEKIEQSTEYSSVLPLEAIDVSLNILHSVLGKHVDYDITRTKHDQFLIVNYLVSYWFEYNLRVNFVYEQQSEEEPQESY